MIKLRVNGETYVDFVAVNVNTSIDQCVSTFAFSATVTPTVKYPFSVGEKVEVIADENKIITGYIDSVTTDYDAGSHNITLAGRSILCDLVDSSINPKIVIQGLTFKSICETVLADVGIKVDVINNAGDEIFETYDLAVSGSGQTAFDFLELLARKRQVLLTTDGEGNLVLSRAGTEKAAFNLQNIVGADDNNILSGSSEKDISEQFNKYTVRGEKSPVDSSETPKNLSDQSGFAIDELIRETRFVEIMSENTTNTTTAGERAKWERNIRTARGISAVLTVQGHSLAGGEIKFNTITDVSDDFLNLYGQFLIKAVNYKYDLQSGSVTTIALTLPDAYTVKAELDAIPEEAFV